MVYVACLEASFQKGTARHCSLSRGIAPIGGTENNGMGALCGNGEFPAAALRVRITHPHLLDDLVRFLERMGFTVEECGYDAVCVDRLGHGEDAVVEVQLRFYIQVWQATRPDVSATFEPLDDTPQAPANP